MHTHTGDVLAVAGEEALLPLPLPPIACQHFHQHYHGSGREHHSVVTQEQQVLPLQTIAVSKEVPCISDDSMERQGHRWGLWGKGGGSGGGVYSGATGGVAEPVTGGWGGGVILLLPLLFIERCSPTVDPLVTHGRAAVGRGDDGQLQVEVVPCRRGGGIPAGLHDDWQVVVRLVMGGLGLVVIIIIVIIIIVMLVVVNVVKVGVMIVLSDDFY